MSRRPPHPPLARAWLALLLVLLWDASGLDMPLARAMGGSASGFALQDNFWLSQVLHSGARQLGLALAAALGLGVIWPWGPLRQLRRAERAWLLLTVLGGTLLISALKQQSASSCPWSLSAFGGQAAYVPHWRLGFYDGGPGHCFPAGHASTAFAFFAPAWLAWARGRRSAWWLALPLAAGLLLGLVQQWRGAHFMSHTLWTGWLCAAFGLASWQALGQRLGPAQAPSPAIKNQLMIDSLKTPVH